MAKRVFLSGLFHETHCFTDDRTGFDQFRRIRGAELLARRGDGTPMDGFLEAAEREGWRVIPGADYSASPSGVVEHAVFEAFWKDVAAALTDALRDGLDAIYLVLHGAMVTDACEDPEGELLARIRATRGAESIPIFAVFDLHATFTEAMARYATCLVTYRENPHTDGRASAVRAADLMARHFKTGATPRMLWRQAPIIWPPTGTGTADTPMIDLERLARRIEDETSDIWVANVVGGFAFSDVADAGVSFSVVTIGDEAQADAALDRLAALAWDLRAKGVVRDAPIDAVLAKLGPEPAGPVVIVEPSDNIGGGAPGDTTGVLRAFIRHGVRRAGVIIADAPAVASLNGVGVGETVTLAIGGKGSRLDEGPLSLAVTLVSRSDGRFTLEDPHSHLAASIGLNVDMGPSAVAQHQGVTILLTSKKTPPFDLGQWRSQGVEPTEFALIGVKAAVAHRQAYNPIAKASYTVATPGPCASDLTLLPYKKLRRPIYPLDAKAARQSAGAV